MLNSSSTNRDPSLTELIQFSSQALLRKTSERSPDSAVNLVRNWVTPEENDTASLDEVSYMGYAAPLMPLRERDVAVLAELFKQDKIDEIEADILHSLLKRCPEPCWEDDPMEKSLEFLEEFL